MPVTTKAGTMAASSTAPYFARDQPTGDLIICAANSMPLPLAMDDDPASQKLGVEKIFRDKAPPHSDRTASILGAPLSQKCAYDILMHRLSMRTTLKAITLCLQEAAKKEMVEEADICIDMLNEAYEYQNFTAHDVVFARHSSLIATFASLLDPWPAQWVSEFRTMREDVLELRFRHLFDGYGTHRRGCLHPNMPSLNALDAYMALSRDVEKGVKILVQALSTEDLWYVHQLHARTWSISLDFESSR
jgi:hypothetical protein